MQVEDEDEFKPKQWLPHEKPSLPGSPSTPLHTSGKRWAFGIVGLIVSITGGLGNSLVLANLVNLQGVFGTYAAEMQWLPAVYVMSSVSMNLVLVKFRQRFGLRSFTVLFLALYAAATFAHLFAHNLAAAIVVRAAHGMVGAALTSLGLYYMIQAFPAQHRLKGIVLGLGSSQLALPLARVFSSDLLEVGEWRGLVLFELGLSLLALGCVLLLRLPPGDRSKPFEKLDILTFFMFAPGVALLSAVLALGKVYWWTDANWIGLCLAGAVLLIVMSLAIEHNRNQPLLNTRWLGTGKILRLALSVLLIRIVLSEAAGSISFMQALGLHTDQMQVMFAWVLVGSILGLVSSAATITPNNLKMSLMFALVVMAIGALMDADSTNLTRPDQLYVSQFLLAFSSTFFFGPTLLTGFSAVLADPRSVISFTVMFSITQNLGGLLGNAFVSTFQTVREKYHSSYLVEHLTLLNPLVASRVQGTASSVGQAIADPSARNAQSLATLSAAATREANVLAYNDVFMVIAAIALLILVGMIVMQFLQRCTGVVVNKVPAASSNT